MAHTLQPSLWRAILRTVDQSPAMALKNRLLIEHHLYPQVWSAAPQLCSGICSTSATPGQRLSSKSNLVQTENSVSLAPQVFTTANKHHFRRSTSVNSAYSQTPPLAPVCWLVEVTTANSAIPQVPLSERIRSFGKPPKIHQHREHALGDSTPPTPVRPY